MQTIVTIRRQWNSWKKATVDFDKLEKLHWSNLSGGVHAPAPQYFVHGYISCADIKGDIDHSCSHGEGPHHIKVVLTKTDNNEVWDKILEIVGPKPK